MQGRDMDIHFNSLSCKWLGMKEEQVEEMWSVFYYHSKLPKLTHNLMECALSCGNVFRVERMLCTICEFSEVILKLPHCSISDIANGLISEHSNDKQWI